MAAYTYDFEYHASKYHGSTDLLSRLPRKTTEEADDWSVEGDKVNRVQIECTPITASRIREATRGDPVLSRVLHFVLHGWPAEENTLEEHLYCVKREEFSVENRLFIAWYQSGNTIQVSIRSAVGTTPKPSRNGRMKSLARQHIWWPNLDSNIEQIVRDCSDCQANRCKTPLKVSNPWIWPMHHWQRLHVDFADPFNGRMFLIVVDAKSKWMEVVPTCSTSASSTITALRGLFATWIA